jgi:putative transposase
MITIPSCRLRGPRCLGERAVQSLIAGYGITCFDELIGHCLGQCYDGEVFFSSLKTERTYRTRDAAKADLFDYFECFYNLRHWAI